ncbi:FAD-dependent oxidoreductase [Bacteroides gallinaceum]|uniref:FAD-dependent oxidoreductase n=1 Tax=Bacteroides gallinaceum TaxID=1462571 RepID=A0ABT7VCU1_9BACE|nr:FAD-dependent oxidoreductase [Bacteroides gallinaceum]MDM8324089.1 FAD-dependent oxidoreductase [Bacteroides gallinaceum]
MKYVIVGGVAGGATAAARIRRNTEKADIILFERGDYISYANCGLPYYIGNVITERERLFVQTPEAFGKRFRVDVRTRSEVTEVNLQKKTVTVRTSDGDTYVEAYDKLLLSPGASPVRPPLPGIESEGIFTLRNVSDTDRIKTYMQQHAVKRAVIVGGGFIGLEMAENLHHAGAEVAVVEMADQVMGPVDYSMAALVHEHLLQKGVKLYLKQAVESFEPGRNGITVRFQSGISLDADLVLLSIGVRPETSLAQKAGLKIGEARGIWVDEYLQTSDASVYAVGDAIEYPHPITGKPWLNYLAGPANRQARIVADNMVFGNKVKYEGAVGTSIAKVFDQTVASTGLAAKRLKQMNVPYLSATIHSASHAGYYPGSSQTDIKIVFSPTDGRLYGAQIVGYEGVDKRIDAYALVIKHHGTVYDLMEVEHAYAPPFSSAKDPVAVSGYVAGNILCGKMTPLYWRELRDADLTKVTLVDVRTADEYALGHIDGALNIPLDDLRERIGEIPSDRPVYVYCGVGLRGYLASNILKENGYGDVRNLIGGIKTYKAATAEVKLPGTGESEEEKARCACNAPATDGSEHSKTICVDACGMQCPGPVLKLKKEMEKLLPGQRLEITATDAGFSRDAESWCRMTGNRIVEVSSHAGKYKVVVEKATSCAAEAVRQEPEGKGKTFILFSDDLDKTLATFVLANGAAATGQKVTVFFTFWGLNAIKKVAKPSVKKDAFGKMFGWMMPSDSSKLGLSKMNMGGIGAKMMRHVMKRRGVDSLESLRQQAIDNGVEFIACQMSMDVMGVKKEELLDNVTVGGVATYMDRAETSNLNMFI